MAFSVTDNCTAIVLSIVIILSGLRVTSSAPANDHEWWINPCNKQIPIRHGRSPAESQLRKFLGEMGEKFFKEIKELYKTTDNEKFKGKCPRINNMLNPIKAAPNFTAATHAFYETLLQFAVFVDKLKDTPVNVKGEFNTSRRKRIFEEAKENLRLLICEYNDTLSNQNNKNVALQSSHKPKVPKINMKCLHNVMSQSEARYVDLDFFKKLQKFLKQSRRLLRLKKKGGAGKKPGRKVPKRTRKSRH